MPLQIREASSPGQLAEFVDCSFQLNAANPLWVPGLKKQEIELLDPKKHPFWQNASRKLFIATRNGRPAGRVAAIIDRKAAAYAHENCGAFGFFECVNDREVAFALLDSVRDYLRKLGINSMRGPLNPSTNYSCGLLVSGFEYPPGLMMPWNPPYYARLLESWHLRKEQDLFAYLIYKHKLNLPDWIKQELERIKAAGMFSCRPADKTTLKADIKIMLELYRKSWAENWGFSPLSAGEEQVLVKELGANLDPRFFVLFFHGQTPVAGMVALPDMTPLLKRLNGKIGLLAPWHYLKARKEIRKGYRIMLFGILPEYRLHGLPMLLLDYMLEQARKIPEIEWVEGSWVLEDNTAIDDLIEDFGGELLKRYRIYRREIGPC